MIRSTLLAAAAAVAFSGAASAATVVIDTFDVTNFQVVGAPTLGNNPQNPATTSGPTPEAIGGIRTITNTRTAPAGLTNAFGQQVQSTVTSGKASVSLGAATQGFSVFSWNAGGADLVDGTNDRITLEVLSTDQNVTFTLNLGGVSVSQTALAAGTLTFAFADFGAADLTNVGAISLLIEGPTSFDTEFDLIQAVGAVPLPAGGLLALAGLGALGAVRARRKA